MRRVRVCLFLLASIPLFLPGEDLEIYGYFQSDILLNQLPEKYFQLHVNKLQASLERELSYNLRFKSDISFFLYYGQSSIPVIEYLPDELAEQIPEEYRDMAVIRYENRYRIDNLYGKYSAGRFDVTVGRQQIYFGSGYSVNPVDFYRKKEIVDPTYQQPGVNALRIDYYPGLSTGFSLLLFPENDLEHSGIMGAFRQTMGHFDVKITGVRTYYTYTSLEAGYLSRRYLRNIAGFSANGQIGDVGVWIESGKNWVSELEDFNETVIGADYTLESGLYLMIEHLYKSNGRGQGEEYTLTDWVRYFNGESKSIIEHQTYLYLNYPLMDLMEIGASALYSFVDGSILLVPEIKYDFSRNAFLTFWGMFNLGPDESLFSRNMGHSALMRFKLFF